jgi:hypothetical protein
VGELAEYKVYYLGVYVGNGQMRVHPTVKYQNEWVRVFTAKAKTGEWYNAIYQADDIVQAYSRVPDYSAVKYYLKQDESKLLGSNTQLEKWYSFDHHKGEVLELEVKKGKQPERERFPFNPGSIDTLGIFYKARTVKYTLGHTEHFPLYSSQKNWQ